MMPRLFALSVRPALIAAFLLTAAGPAQASGEPAAKPWVLLPTSIEDIPPEYLAYGTAILDEVLAEELRARGLDIQQLSLVDGVQRWLLEVARVGGVMVDVEGLEHESVSRARSNLVLALVREYNAAGVIWPDLQQRDARNKKAHLMWDGVTRRIPDASHVYGSRAPRLGSSLRVRVFDEQGVVSSDKYRGLEVIHRFQTLDRGGDLKAKGYYVIRTSTIWFSFPIRSDLFEDRGLLAEAVNRAIPLGRK